jgi:GTP-binding protein
LIALNKVDLPDGKAMADMVQPILEARGYQVYQISAASHIGLTELNYAMARIIQEARKAEALVEKARIVLRPVAVGNSGFTVTANADGSFTVLGDKPVRWVKQTDFGNTEAIGYLADRLATLGVEKELFKKGAKAKDEVRIGEGDNAVIFDWEPSIEAGAELLAGPRGGDLRLESPWAGRYTEDLVDDQLSDDEIAMQWEYNIENPRDPRVVVEAISEEK